MAILSVLNAEHFGTWPSVLDFLQDVNRRQTAALAALNAALSATPEDQRELAAGDGLLVLADVAGDQRVQKGSRLAAVRCAMEAQPPAPVLVGLFVGGGELAADPRLGAAAKRLVEAGIPAVLADPQHPSARVSMAAGTFARGVHAAASVVGLARLKELVAPAGAAHSGVNAGLFALGQAPIPPSELEQWKKLLREACGANRRAPAAAKRLGMAPPWPPAVPDAFRELIAEAEKETANVVAIDAAKGGVIRGTAGQPAAPPVSPTAPAAGKPAPPAKPTAPPIQGRPRAGSIGAPLPPPSSRPVPPPPGKPGEPPPPSQTKMPPIKQSPYRRAIGTVVEGPFVAPTRHLPPMNAQVAPGSAKAVEAPPAPEKDAPVLPGLAPLPSLKPKTEFDSRGRKVPKVDRWRETEDWEEPLLPSSELRPPPLVRAALGPFALRLKSLFEDRPEAVDRLCAAAEARALMAGEDQMERELSQELSLPRWQKPASAEQRQRLSKIAADESRHPSWRRAARAVLDRLKPDA